jgi:hypothetical protein
VRVAEGLVGSDDEAGSFIAGRDQLEEQVGGLWLAGDVADFVDDQHRVAAQPGQFGLQVAALVGVGEAGDPLGGGGERDPVPGLAGPDRQPGGQVGFAGAGRPEKDHVLPACHEVQGAQVGDDFSFQSSGMVVVELFQGLAGGEPGGPDTALAAVGLAGGDLTLQAGGQELLVRPGLGPGPLSQPRHRLPQRGGLQRPGQERDLRGGVPAVPGGGHHATPPSARPSAVS